jgi:hypothetical protein
MRRATAVKLSAPSFVEMAIAASMLLHPNIFVTLLAPLMFLAFVLLIVGVAIASKNHEQTSRGAWTCLVLAAVAQMFTFVSVARS